MKTLTDVIREERTRKEEQMIANALQQLAEEELTHEQERAVAFRLIREAAEAGICIEPEKVIVEMTGGNYRVSVLVQGKPNFDDAECAWDRVRYVNALIARNDDTPLLPTGWKAWRGNNGWTQTSFVEALGIAAEGMEIPKTEHEIWIGRLTALVDYVTVVQAEASRIMGGLRVTVDFNLHTHLVRLSQARDGEAVREAAAVHPSFIPAVWSDPSGTGVCGDYQYDYEDARVCIYEEDKARLVASYESFVVPDDETDPPEPEIVCPGCGGMGRVDDLLCPNCNGAGTVELERSLA